MNKATTTICVVILLIGMFLRVYDYKERFYYGHDNDLASWIVKDVVVNHHHRLIGQLTSSPGIFIGSFFYYALIPFYLLGHMDPVYSVGFSWLMSLLSILSIFYVTAKIHGKKTAIFATLIYALSSSIVSTDREVVPTTAVHIWSIWFYYAISNWFNKKTNSIYIFAILFALVWHIHLILGLLSIIVIIGYLPQIKHIEIKKIILAATIFFILGSPLFSFEYRHNFSQTRALFGSFGQHARVERTVSEKFIHVGEYVAKNINNIVWEKPESINKFFIPLILAICILISFLKQKVSSTSMLPAAIWIGLITTFFALHPINLSEYYLNSLNIIWIVWIGIIFASIWSNNKIAKFTVLSALSLFAYHNINRYLFMNVNKSGYVEKTAIISAIARDAQNHGYPCVSISYITDPGNNLGYRYLIWYKGLKTAPITNKVPVYSIVYPHVLVGKIDESFGAIGLIYPEYEKFSMARIIENCQGPDQNTTESMFGFTK